MDRARSVLLHPALRGVVAVIAIVGGLGVVIAVAALEDCSAFGGRCPSEPDDDVFWFAAAGAAAASGVPVLMARPTRRGLVVAVTVAAVVGALVGLMVMSEASTF